MAVQYNPTIVTDSLLCCLDAVNKKSYPGTGVTWSDCFITGARAALTNGATFNNQFSSMFFDGTNDFCGITLNSLLTSWSNSISVEAWVYFPSGITWWASADTRDFLLSNIVSAGNFSPTAPSLWKQQPENIVAAAVRGTGNLQPITATGDIKRDTFTQLVSVWNGPSNPPIGASASISLYINGSFIRGTNISAVNYANNFGLTLPSNSWSIAENKGIAGSGFGFFGGYIANIKWYTKALNANEVAQNFNALRGRFGI
jgi:hypothetical protein